MLKGTVASLIVCISMLLGGCYSLKPVPDLAVFSDVSLLFCGAPLIWTIEEDSDSPNGKIAICGLPSNLYFSYGYMFWYPMQNKQEEKLSPLPVLQEIRHRSQVKCKPAADWEIRKNPNNPKGAIAICRVPNYVYVYQHGYYPYGYPMHLMYGYGHVFYR